MNDIAAIILAAGESSRMGQPKALLEYQGKTFLDTISDKFKQAGCDPVIVVIPVGFALTPDDLAARNLLYRYNESPENGQFSSLILGMSQVPPSAEAAFFCPVDHPAFQPDTLEKIYVTWGGDRKLAVRPRCDGRHGHPVLLGKLWLDRALKAVGDANMRDLLHSNSRQVLSSDVNDSGILIDVDTPEDYQQLIQK